MIFLALKEQYCSLYNRAGRRDSKAPVSSIYEQKSISDKVFFYHGVSSTLTNVFFLSERLRYFLCIIEASTPCQGKPISDRLMTC